MGLTAGLSQQLRRGSAYLAFQAISIRVVTMAVYFWLAAVLSREEFGQLAIATSLVAIFDLSILLDVPMSIGRLGSKTPRLVRSAMVASAIAGTASVVGIVLVTLVFARYSTSFASSAKVIAIAAAAIPTNAIHTNCISFLRSRFQFQAATMLESSRLLAASVASIVFAYRGFGAASVVLPQLLFSVAMLPIAICCVRGKCGPVRMSRVRYVLLKGLAAIPGNLAVACTRSLDNLIVSSFFSLRDTGRYFFAYGLSVQSINLLGPIAQQAIVPVLSRIPSSQMRSLEFAKLLTKLSRYLVPVCFVQAGLMPVAIHVVYGDKWAGTELLVVILSVAMGVRVVGLLAGTLFKLNGAYSTLSAYNIAYGILFTILVLASAQAGSLIWVCVSLLAFYSFVSVFHFWNAIRRHVDGSGTHVMDSLKPIAASAIAFSIPFGASSLLFGDFKMASASGAVSVLALVICYAYQDRCEARIGKPATNHQGDS